MASALRSVPNSADQTLEIYFNHLSLGVETTGSEETTDHNVEEHKDKEPREQKAREQKEEENVYQTLHPGETYAVSTAQKIIRKANGKLNTVLDDNLSFLEKVGASILILDL